MSADRTATRSPADLEATVREGISLLEGYSGPDRGHAMLAVFHKGKGWCDEHSAGCKPCRALSDLALLREQAERTETLWKSARIIAQEGDRMTASYMYSQDDLADAVARTEAAEARVRELEGALLRWKEARHAFMSGDDDDAFGELSLSFTEAENALKAALAGQVEG